MSYRHRKILGLKYGEDVRVEFRGRAKQQGPRFEFHKTNGTTTNPQCRKDSAHHHCKIIETSTVE
uniref:Uncharacterized protein n=1 Tax=Ciona savignyi TaxID=51511 RepID=H2Z544_CIOSA